MSDARPKWAVWWQRYRVFVGLNERAIRFLFYLMGGLAVGAVSYSKIISIWPSVHGTEQAEPGWVGALRQNPIIPGRGLAGLNVGDPESNISAKFKLALPPATQVVGRGEEIFLDDKKGLVLYYAITFRSDGLFLGVYTDRDKRIISSFRFWDSNFNKSGLLPSFRGITIGTTKQDVLTSMGKPQREQKSLGCSGIGSETVTYYYPGISFSVCENGLVYMIDIP
jgi:hypothetical protein